MDIAIKNMLTNEKYIGNVLLCKTYTVEFPNNKQKINHGEQQQFLKKGTHASIVASGVFEAVQKEMKRRSNIEIVDGKVRRKDTHYSTKDIKCQE